MRDQYAGDVSDVLKFAFLRAFVGADRTLGIAWYYAPGDDGRADGRHLEWRDEPAWRKLNADLHAGLAALPERSISALEGTSIWPRGALFHREPMPPRVERNALPAVVSVGPLLWCSEPSINRRSANPSHALRSSNDRPPSSRRWPSELMRPDYSRHPYRVAGSQPAVERVGAIGRAVHDVGRRCPCVRRSKTNIPNGHQNKMSATRRESAFIIGTSRNGARYPWHR